MCECVCKQRCWWLYSNDWAGVEAGLSTRLPAEFLKDPTDAIPNSLGRLLMLPGTRLLPSPCTSSWPCCLSHTPPSMRVSVWLCMCVRHVPAQQGLRQPWQIVEKVPLNPALTSTWAWGLYTGREQSAPLLLSFFLHPSITPKWEREDSGNKKKKKNTSRDFTSRDSYRQDCIQY